MEYQEKYKYLSNVLLNVTDDCNLACRYCFVEQHPHYMTLETAKKAADWVYNNLQKKIELDMVSDKQKASLYFFGGEPTLCYNSIIMPIVEYCKEKYPNSFEFGITTNGTLLNKEKIDFFKENNFSLLLSIDGAKTTQDYNRPCKNSKQSSFDLVEQNINYLLECFPNTCFRSTIYSDTVQHLFENYLYAESLGFKKYEMIEDSRHPWNDESLEILKNEFSKIYLYRLEQIINNKVPMYLGRFDTWLYYTTNLLDDESKLFDISNNNGVERCGLGTISGSIGWDGNIYGCQEQPSKDDKNLFLIGNIFEDGINPEKHFQLLTFYYEDLIKMIEKKSECKNCKLNNICKVNMQSCPSTTYDLYKDMHSITDITCYIRQLYFWNSILFLEVLNEFGGEEYLRKAFIPKIE